MMSDMVDLLRSRITLAWLVLVGLTVLSWWLGTNHGLGADNRTAAGVVVLVVAFAKVRLIGRYFMELRDSALPLLISFECYCAGVCVAVVGFYLASV
ncbi:MAG: cytochrome C oxidase subunit IV family protein [Actinomycetia bacterium]|nr:cytochrome C oxidase subunit IV family protein [Actinomycetes bacterium]